MTRANFLIINENGVKTYFQSNSSAYPSYMFEYIIKAIKYGK